MTSNSSAAWHPRRSATVLKASRSALDFFHRVEADILLRLVSDTAALHLNSAHFKLCPSNSANPNQPPRARLTPVVRSLAFMVVTLTAAMEIETFESSG
jgi:hypothetical protein